MLPSRDKETPRYRKPPASAAPVHAHPLHAHGMTSVTVCSTDKRACPPTRACFFYFLFGGGVVSMEAYCMSAYEVITRSAHGLLLEAPSLGGRSCYRCWSTLPPSACFGWCCQDQQCLFISIRVCTPVYLEHTCVPGIPPVYLERHQVCLGCMQAALSSL